MGEEFYSTEEGLLLPHTARWQEVPEMRLDTFMRTLGEGMSQVMRQQGVGDLHVDQWMSHWALMVADVDTPRDNPYELVATFMEHLYMAREITRIYGRG